MIDQFRVILARLRAEDAAMATMPERVRHYHGAGLDGNRNQRMLDLLEALVDERIATPETVSLPEFTDLQITTDAALTAFIEAEQEVQR